MKFYRFTEDTSGLFFRQYYRLTPTGTYLNFGMNFSFLIISLLILGLFSTLMFRKSYIYMFACAQIVLKESLYSYFTILVHSMWNWNISRLVTKPTKDFAPSEDSDQPGHPPSLMGIFAVRTKKAWVLSYPLSAQRRLWSDWADAQADLSLCWAHSHFVGFVTRRHICCWFKTDKLKGRHHQKWGVPQGALLRP